MPAKVDQVVQKSSSPLLTKCFFNLVRPLLPLSVIVTFKGLWPGPDQGRTVESSSQIHKQRGVANGLIKQVRVNIIFSHREAKWRQYIRRKVVGKRYQDIFNGYGNGSEDEGETEKKMCLEMF